MRSPQAVPADAAAPLHLRIHLFLAAGFHRRRAPGLSKCARPWAPQLAREAPADRRRRGAGARFRRAGRARLLRRHLASRSISASSAITMSAAPSSSRRSRSARSACGSSTTPTARWSNGKRIVLIDDSIVRGTTSTKIVQMMRDAGAKEVHFRIASPPITHPDYYGIDTPDRDKLLAATHNLEEMRAFIGADLLAFLSVEGIYKSMGYEKPRSAAPAIHRPLLHRRISDAAHRPVASKRTRRGNCRCSPKRADATLKSYDVEAPLRPYRACHRRLARDRLCDRDRARAGRRACRRAGAHRRRPGRARRRDQESGLDRDARAARPERPRRHRAARRRAQRALWQARCDGRQRRLCSARSRRSRMSSRRRGAN